MRLLILISVSYTIGCSGAQLVDVPNTTNDPTNYGINNSENNNGSSSSSGSGAANSNSPSNGSSSGVIFDTDIDASSAQITPQFSNQTLIPYATAAQYQTCDSYCASVGKTCSASCMDGNVGDGNPAAMEFVCQLPNGSIAQQSSNTYDSNISTQTIDSNSSCTTNIQSDFRSLTDPLSSGVNGLLSEVYCYLILSDGGAAASPNESDTIGTMNDNFVRCCCQ